MRLLLINPNTTASITDKVAAEARRIASPGTEIVPVTGAFGARYISSRAAYAVAAHAALDAYARGDPAHDAVVLACFGDPGLDALREISPRPVVGMADASVKAACTLGAKFSIVTGGTRWVAMLEEFVASRGQSARLASVRAVPQTGGAIAADPNAAVDALARTCRDAAERDGADVVVLGGAAMAGLAARLSKAVPVPLVDCIEAMIREAIVRASEVSLDEQASRVAPVESVGIAPALAARLP
jgi:Asp/Glu/hydantoin racemase